MKLPLPSRQKFHVIDGPLMSEYLLYFTIHETVQTEPIPLTYEPISLPESWQELTSAEEYKAAIEQIHHHIRQGDTYQVNYTVQLQQKLTADPLPSITDWLLSKMHITMPLFSTMMFLSFP